MVIPPSNLYSDVEFIKPAAVRTDYYGTMARIYTLLIVPFTAATLNGE
jgi:hypothetical protein